MSLYDNAFPSNYEEIRVAFGYPVWYFDVLEMDAVWRASGAQLDKVQAGIEAMIANNFIASADENAIGAVERFLNISTAQSKSLDERRALVASFFSAIASPHCGASDIKNVVLNFNSIAPDVQFSSGTITVSIPRSDARTINFDDCLQALKRLIPCHLRLSIILEASCGISVLPIMERYLFTSRLAGTHPYRNVVASLVDVDINAPSDGTPYPFTSIMSGTRKAGTEPDRNMEGVTPAAGIQPVVETTAFPFENKLCGAAKRL